MATGGACISTLWLVSAVEMQQPMARDLAPGKGPKSRFNSQLGLLFVFKKPFRLIRQINYACFVKTLGLFGHIRRACFANLYTSVL